MINNSLYVIVIVAFLSFSCNSGNKSHDKSTTKNSKHNYYRYNSENISLLKNKITNPSSPQETDKNRWGIQFNTLPPHATLKYSEIDFKRRNKLTDKLLKNAEELGVKWSRVSVNWSTIEDTNGNYHWEYLDKIVKGLNDINVNIYLCLHGGHPEFTDENPPSQSKKGLKKWIDWVDATVKRYKSKINYWEVWNEPNYPGFWGGESDVKEYYNLLKPTYKKIKSIDSTAIVLGGSVARFDFPYAKKLINMGGYKFMDCFTVHPYNNYPESVIDMYQQSVKTPEYYMPATHLADSLNALLTPHNIELWMGECGYPSGQNSHGWTGNGPWGENIQGKWILRRALTDIAINAKITGYFCLKEYNFGPDDDRKNRKGLLTLNKLNRKSSFGTYQNLISFMKGKIEGSLKSVDLYDNVDIEINENGGFPGAKTKDIFYGEFNNKDTKFIAYYLPWHMQEIVENGNVSFKIKENPFKNPVLVDLLKGNIYKIDNKNLTNLPISDYPLIITEKSSIN